MNLLCVTIIIIYLFLLSKVVLTKDLNFCSGVLVLCGADLNPAAVHAFIFHGDVFQHQSAADHSDLSRTAFVLYNGRIGILDTKKTP